MVAVEPRTSVSEKWEEEGRWWLLNQGHERVRSGKRKEKEKEDGGC